MAEGKQLNWDLSPGLTHLWPSAFIPLSCWHNQGSEGCGSAKVVLEISAGLGANRCVCSLFLFNLFCGACSVLCFCHPALYGTSVHEVFHSCSSASCWECPWNFQSEGIRSVWGVPCHMDRSYLEGISCFQSSWERIANSSPYATEYSPA